MNSKTQDLCNPSFEQIEELIKELILKIKQSNQHFNKVLGIARGGLFISIPIAKELKLPHQEIHISHYQDNHELRNKPKIKTLPKEQNCLIVDDLIDKGYTIKACNTLTSLPGNKVGSCCECFDHICWC